MILANAKDPQTAMTVFDNELAEIYHVLEHGDFPQLEGRLADTARQLRELPMKRPPHEVPIVTILGEIFVRRDALSRQYITERLAKLGFATACSPISEWMHYSDYLVDIGQVDYNMKISERFKFFLKKRMMAKYEKRIKAILAATGLIHEEPLDIQTIVDNARPYVSPNLTGEAILTVGGSITDVATLACGVIAIGPFGCMPNRLSEAILNKTMNRETKLATEPQNRQLRTVLTDVEDLPFLAIESDGQPFPQLINAKLETFCLRAERLHQKMMNAARTNTLS
jgi:predicted nucleotide-binding protein (sugar kinase/HSP70/actin superfamily)